jgi:hypothetical protein
MYIIFIGNAVDGFEIVGPFKSEIAAEDWANQHCNEPYSISVLINPISLKCEQTSHAEIHDAMHLPLDDLFRTDGNGKVPIRSTGRGEFA